MEEECSARASQGHLWRRHGTYRRSDGSLIQRWQCGECKKTTTRRPGRESPLIKRPGPQRGHTLERPEDQERFWAVLATHLVRVGLHEATKSAAKAVGVDPATGSRWLRLRRMFPTDSGIEWSLLSDALQVIRMPRPKLPKVTGIDRWREIRGWEHPELSEGNFGEPEYSRLLRRNGRRLWELLLRAGSVASVVAGDGSPLQFASLADVPEKRLQALRAGGLLSRPGRNRHHNYWLSFDHNVWESWATALVCTRTRVIGTAKGEFPRLPTMSVRLDLDGAWTSRGRVHIPVPSATRVHHRTPLTFPLEFDLGASPHGSDA